VRAPFADPPEPPGRAPDNELFDRGCDLVEAAGAIRRLTSDPRSARAVPGLLGCIEASLDELAAAAATLEQADPVDGEAHALVDAAADARRRRGLGNLRVALADAAAAAQAARALTARVLTRIARD
jgi:hypothetical protein